jgi:hypothetical protein
MAECVEVSDLELPDPIVDLGTLSISMDNRGIARLSITILTKSTDSITGSCTINVGDGRTLMGTIVEDSPKELVGTVYYEHNVAAVGMIE